MTIRAVLFDLGGTLIHYHDAQHGDPERPFRRVTLLGARALITRAMDGANNPPDPDTIAATVDKHISQTFSALAETQGGGSVEAPIRAALAELGFPQDDAHWAALRPVYYGQIEPIVFPRAGVRETLDKLHAAGYKLGIVSNTWWAADFHDAHLARYNLLDLLPVRLYSCDLPHSKPHPDIFKDALARVGVEPAEAVFVGDRPDIDVRAAQAVGMRGVLIRSPYMPPYERPPQGEPAPDAIIDELADLPAAVEAFA